MRITNHGLVALIQVTLLTATASRAIAGAQDWEIEVHGGAIASGNPTKGTKDLPAGGVAVIVPPPPIPVTPTRVVPSWFFGDGALLLNEIGGGRFGAGIAPLDTVLESRLVERRSGTSAGARVTRSLSPRFSAEFAIDEAFGALALTTESASAVKAAQASFVTTWNLLLNGPAGGAQTVDSDATIVDKRGRQIMTTGAVVIKLARTANVTPYVAVGAGLIATRNGTPSVKLVGKYHFTFPPGTPPIPVQRLVVDQTDTVTAHTVADKTVTWVIGGGVKYAVAERWGVRIDVRDHVNKDPMRTIVDAVPATAPSGSQGTLVLFFSPSSQMLQFSTSAFSPSTLGGNPVVAFKTFAGTGIVNQVNLAAGLYWRF
jgi:hypothetical protein